MKASGAVHGRVHAFLDVAQGANVVKLLEVALAVEGWMVYVNLGRLVTSYGQVS